MYEAEYLCVSRVFPDGFETRLIILNVLLHLSTLHVEHVDQHGDVLKYIIPLRGEVVLHERLLSTAIPQVEHEVAEETYVRVFHVDSRTETTRVASDVVCKDDRSHARLTRS